MITIKQTAHDAELNPLYRSLLTFHFIIYLVKPQSPDRIFAEMYDVLHDIGEVWGDELADPLIDDACKKRDILSRELACYHWYQLRDLHRTTHGLTKFVLAVATKIIKLNKEHPPLGIHYKIAAERYFEFALGKTLSLSPEKYS